MQFAIQRPMTSTCVLMLDLLWVCKSFFWVCSAIHISCFYDELLSSFLLFREQQDLHTTIFCMMKLDSQQMTCKSWSIHCLMCKQASNLLLLWMSATNLINPSSRDFILSFLLLDCRYQRSTTAISVGKNNLELWFFTGFTVLKIEYDDILLLYSDLMNFSFFFFEQLHLYVMPTWQQHRWHSLSSLMKFLRPPRAMVEFQQLVVC